MYDPLMKALVKYYFSEKKKMFDSHPALLIKEGFSAIDGTERSLPQSSAWRVLMC